MMDNLIGVSPASLLVHGPTKRLVDAYHWHEPDMGIIASYSPTSFDVNDHFGVFRGVDMIESFAQAVNCSCATFLESKKQNCSIEALKELFNPIFFGIGQVNFTGYLEKGEVMICIGHIKFYKFRQMTCDGHIYKVPAGFNIGDYFKSYTKTQFLAFDFPSDFTLVAELNGITGKMIKKEKMLK